MHPMLFEDSSVTMHPMHFEPAARLPPKQKGPVQRFVRTRAEQQPLTPSSKGTSQRCGVLVASCAISTGPRPSLTPPRCGTRDPRAPGLCSAGGSTRHSCGGPLLLTRWRAVARCADGSSALQALLSVGRVQPGHSQFTRLLRAEYFLWRRRMQTGCTRLAVKQWPGIGVAMECARDAPLPRPSAVLPCACDFTRCDPASLGASLYSPRHGPCVSVMQGVPLDQDLG
jgi:hypothetical protein